MLSYENRDHHQSCLVRVDPILLKNYDLVIAHPLAHLVNIVYLIIIMKFCRQILIYILLFYNTFQTGKVIPHR